MPTVTASAGTITLTSRRTNATWSVASYTATLTFPSPIPQNCTITAATLTATVSQDPMSGSTFWMNGTGTNTGKGAHSIAVSIAPGTASYAVTVTFKGSGTANKTSIMELSGLVLAVTYELNQVKSTFTLSASNIAAGGSVKVTISSYSSAYTHTVTLAFGSRSSSASLAAGVTAASISAPIGWLDQIPNASSGQGSVTVTTLENGTAFGSNTAALTITVPDSAAPSIGTCSVAPLLTVGSVTYPAVVAGGYVQGKCGYRATISGAAGKYGATIKAYSIQGGGYSGTDAALSSGLLTQAGTVTITFKVVDSRGKAASHTLTITVLPYTGPQVTSLTAWRTDADGNASDIGAYAQWRCTTRFESLSSANSLQIKAYLQENGSAEQEIGAPADGGAASWVQDTTGGRISISLLKKYFLRVTLTDAYGAVNQTIELPSANFAMHFNAAGNGVCFGGACTRENAVEIARGRGLWLGEHRVGAAARNLLDNSDFANPVNQRGQSSYAGIGYTIDRWRTWDENAAVTLHAGEGITLEKILYQYSEPGKLHTGGIYTIAICLGDGTVCCASGALNTTGFSYFVGDILVLLQQEESGAVFMAIQAAGGETVRWAAVYEGDYGASSLPAYLQNGYVQELMTCKRFYAKYGDDGQYNYAYTNGYIAGFIFAVPMRVAPTVISASALKLSDFSAAVFGNYHVTNANGVTYLNVPAAVSGEWYRLTGLELSADL